MEVIIGNSKLLSSAQGVQEGLSKEIGVTFEGNKQTTLFRENEIISTFQTQE